MIIGSLNDTERIEILNPHFKKIFDYLKSHDLQSLPLGKTEIDGDRAWLNVSEVEGKTEALAEMETHDQYIDIQLPLEGAETFGWQSRGELTHEAGSGYDVVKDITLCRPGCCILYFVCGAILYIFSGGRACSLYRNGKDKKNCSEGENLNFS